MPELLSPAGCPESITAAVESGADAVYVHFGSSSDHKSFSYDEFSRAAEFCRIRGVKIYAYISEIPSDNDFTTVLKIVRAVCRLGADAVIVNDPGVIRAIRHAYPDLPIHAGPGMNIHDLNGVKVAAAMGAKRAAIARELSFSDISFICANSPIEIEVMVHGPSCASYEGQCFLSTFSGGGSALSGKCSRPCLLEYATGTKELRPFAFADTCLLPHIEELSGCGVAAMRIDGISRSPEYVSVTAETYSRITKTGSAPSLRDRDNILHIAPGATLSDGYFTGNRDTVAAGYPGEDEPEASSFAASVKKSYLNREYQRVPVKFTGVIRSGEPIKLRAEDDRGNVSFAEGSVPSLAFHRSVTNTMLQTELFKTGGTPFFCAGVKCDIDQGLTIPFEEISHMRDEMLTELIKQRGGFEPRAESEFMLAEPMPSSHQLPVLTLSVTKASQLSDRLLELAPPVIYVPAEEIVFSESRLSKYISTEGVSVCASLPRVLYDSEQPGLIKTLETVKKMGVKELLVSHISQIVLARSLGFSVRGDTGLNVMNSQTVHILRTLGVSSVTLSPELDIHQVKEISKETDAELVVYGRMPLMHTASCIPKSCTGICSCESFGGVSDSNGFVLPVVRDFGCRNTVYSAKKLFLADRSSEYMASGLWGVRLSFTTENPIECVSITERYLGLSKYTPASFMRGKY